MPTTKLVDAKFAKRLVILNGLVPAALLVWDAYRHQLGVNEVNFAIHTTGLAIILMVGGHYTYAEVPLGFWMERAFHLTRNDYDRIGHFAQGFVPAIAAREILLRRGVVRGRGWLYAIVVLICLGISAAYELLEWTTALATGGRADAFLGTQGDPWDTQEDMATALVGALLAPLVLGRVHNRQIARMATET